MPSPGNAPTSELQGPEASHTDTPDSPRDAGEGEDPPEALPPGHPLLQRAQAALRAQLQATRLRLQEELREKRLGLQAARKRREEAGVELYGHHQHLAQLHGALGRAAGAHAAAQAEGAELTQELQRLREEVAAQEAGVQRQAAGVAARRAEQDRLRAALRAVGRDTDAAANEIAVAKRVAYATEESLLRLESEAGGQGLLLDLLQARLARLQAQAAEDTAAAAASAADTADARRRLAEASAQMESVEGEKAELVARWCEALAGTRRREEVLQEVEAALRQQGEELQVVRLQAEGRRREAEEEAAAEAAVEVLVGRQREWRAALERQRDSLVAEQEGLQARQLAAQVDLRGREAALAAAAQEASQLLAECRAAERRAVSAEAEARALHGRLLDEAGEKAGEEQGTAHALREARSHAAAAAAKEARVAELRAQLERTQATAVAEQEQAAVLTAELEGLEAALLQRGAAVEVVGAEIERQRAAVEASTRGMDSVNRRLQRLAEQGGDPDGDKGPPELAILSLRRDLEASAGEGRALQGRWEQAQGALLALQGETLELGRGAALLRAQRAVMQQRSQHLEQQLAQRQRETKALGQALEALHAEGTRLNGLLAEARAQRGTASEGAALLESDTAAELKGLEGRWAEIQAALEALREERSEAAAQLLAAEQDTAQWARRVQVETEMQAALDPECGAEGIAELQRSVARLQHAQAETGRRQSALAAELERGMARREAVALRGQVAKAPRAQEATQAQLQKAVADLRRSLKAAAREGQAADAEAAELAFQLEAAEQRLAAGAAACEELEATQAALQESLASLAQEKSAALAATVARQKEATRRERALLSRQCHAAPPPPSPKRGPQQAA